MPRVNSASLVSLITGVVCASVLSVTYVASAPPLVRDWIAGSVTPTPATGWYEWPVWLSAAVVSVTIGLIFAASRRLGASPMWAASAALSCGLSWSVWMLAIVPSLKAFALLLAGLGITAVAWWGAGGRVVWLTMAIVCLAASAWIQPLVSGVRMPVSFSFLAAELLDGVRPLALLLTGVGLLELWSQRRRAAVALGALLTFYLLLPLTAGVPPAAAMIAGVLPLWIAVAFGLHWVTRVVPGRAGLALAVFLALLMPGERWLMTQAAITQAAPPFFPGSLALSLAAIPAGGTLLSDGPAADRQIARAIAVFPATAPFRVLHSETSTSSRNPSDVFAFNALRRDLEAVGIGFATVPRRVPLSVFLNAIPAGDIVAIALTPIVAAAMPRDSAAYFAGIGATLVDTTDPTLSFTLVGHARAPSGAKVHQDRETSQVTVAPGVPLGSPARPSPIAIEATADRNSAAIAVAGRELLRVPHGGALVVTSREGLLQGAYVMTSAQKLLMPLPADEWSLARVVRASSGDPLLDPLFADPLDASAFVRFDGRDHGFFRSGWHQPERDGPIEFVWTSDVRSSWRIRLARPLDLRVIVELRPAVIDERDPPQVGLQVNGTALERRPTLPRRSIYEWEVPESAWRSGDNEVVLEITRLAQPAGSQDLRTLGAAVSLFRLERVRR